MGRTQIKSLEGGNPLGMKIQPHQTNEAEKNNRYSFPVLSLILNS